MKQTLKIGITMMVVAALAMSGVALAQTTEDDTIDIEDTRAYEALQQQLAPLVEDDTISQEQADAVAALLAENMREFRGRGRGLRALQAAAESGSERDIKNARTLFLRLKPGDRRAALAMLDE